MSDHLSQDQFAKCLVGRSTSAEVQHIAECAECSAELDAFGHTISMFRNAIRERIDIQSAQRPVFELPLQPKALHIPKWAWGVVAAIAAALVMVPVWSREGERQEVVEVPPISEPMSPEVLMNAVTIHLSRTVPAPLEKIMTLIATDESMSQTGGVQ